MKINKTLILAFLSSALLAGGAYADNHGKRGQNDRGFGGGGAEVSNPDRMVKRLTKHLELDETQQDSVRNIMEAAKPEVDALRDQVRANRAAIKELATNDAEIQNLAISNGALATEATLLFARVRGEVNAVLTDEQRTKLAELKNRKGDGKRRRKNRR